MMKDDRLRVLRAPILVENIDAILGRNETHGNNPFSNTPRFVRVARRTSLCLIAFLMPRCCKLGCLEAAVMGDSEGLGTGACVAHALPISLRLSY